MNKDYLWLVSFGMLRNDDIVIFDSRKSALNYLMEDGIFDSHYMYQQTDNYSMLVAVGEGPKEDNTIVVVKAPYIRDVKSK